jgi:glyceraldehyde-3-phosphate dehydrogenase/erythrose-4-phosphate dehydrogenase
MKVDFKVTVNTQIPDSEVNEILKETNKKISDYRKLLQYEMEKAISNMFIQDELIACKVKVSFKKEESNE